MTLLVNRPKTEIQVTEYDGHVARERTISPKPVPPVDTLRTLQARLQAQLENREDNTDPADGGHAEHGLIRSVQRRLSQVNAALERVEEGKYGICTDCAKPIESERMVLRPMTTRCASCQAVAEWRGATY